VEDWADWKGPEWGDIRIKRDDLLRLLQLTSDARNGHFAAQVAAFYSSTLTMEELFAHNRRQMAVRQRRQSRIINQIRQSGEWVSFAAIAAWFAREKGSIEPDEHLRAKAFRELGAALATCEFGLGRQSRVLFLHPRSNWAKMTPERFSEILFGDELSSSYLRHCWIPRDLAGGWFDSRNLRRPGHLFPRAEEEKITLLEGGGKKVGPDSDASVGARTPPKAYGTVAEEVELRRWLAAQMAAAPEAPRTKAAIGRSGVRLVRSRQEIIPAYRYANLIASAIRVTVDPYVPSRPTTREGMPQ
jgi:hypothetical protein